MKRQGGFTLIELVVVIVILGILAVTAAPRFLNLQDDARNASLEGLKGAMAGASSMVYGKAAILGQESAVSASIDIGTGTNITVEYGYPQATSAAMSQIVQGISGTNSDFKFVKEENNILVYGIDGYTAKCVTYTEATTSSAPATIVVSDSNCS